MNVFEARTTNTDQGNIGEAAAIFQLTKMGYNVCKPIFNNQKYDLIIDDGEKLQKVQVKTSSQRTETGEGRMVQLSTSGGNQKINTIAHRNVDDYDLLFVLLDDGRMWLIPGTAFNNGTTINVGSKGAGSKYHEYELNVDVVYQPPKTNSRIWELDEQLIIDTFKKHLKVTPTLNELGVYPSSANISNLKDILGDKMCISNEECKHFNKEELQELVDRLPLTKIGKMYNISDNAVKRYVKKWDVKQPPRGYFLKQT